MVLKGLDIFTPEEFLDILISVKWASKESISLSGLKKAIDS